MPWALIEVRRQWSREEETAIIDAVHAAMVAAFRIPVQDKHVRLQVHEPQLIESVIRMVDRAEYKRRQYPPGPKITPKNFGRDRRLPITNRWREVAP